MMYVEPDDFRQIWVVAKNEVRKFVRGRRFLIYCILIIGLFALMTAMPLIDGNLGDTVGEIMSLYIIWVSLLIILAATLFASVTISSEFEERTALILFTRPIKKTSIFIGKIIGCIFLETIMIAVFYVCMAAVSFFTVGSASSHLPVSFGLAFLYVIATSGIAMLFSSLFKKGSTAAILTFVTLLLLLPILVSGVVGSHWFMLNVAADAISECIPEYLDQINSFMQEIADQVGMDFGIIGPPDVGKAAIAMITWGSVSILLSWIVFLKREL